MPRAATSSSLSPGTLSQCRPWSVCEREMTSEMGSEFEFPKTYVVMTLALARMASQSRHNIRGVHTPMAVTKLEALFRKPKSRLTACATQYDTRV